MNSDERCLAATRVWSPEICMKLKEIGFPQESAYYWCEFKDYEYGGERFELLDEGEAGARRFNAPECKQYAAVNEYYILQELLYKAGESAITFTVPEALIKLYAAAFPKGGSYHEHLSNGK